MNRSIAWALLITASIAAAANQQCAAARQNAPPGGVCKFPDEPAATARLSVTGDILGQGQSEVTLLSVSGIEVQCTSVPGHTIPIPPDLVRATFTVEPVPIAEISDGGVPEKATTRARQIRLRIAKADATVNTFSFPSRGLTGVNRFAIVPDKTSIVVDGVSGKAALRGEAEARMTNRFFSEANAINIRITFTGEYDFASRVVTLTHLEADGRSSR